jgi:NitT/TauT family transport system substrate-binding protein
MVRFPRSAFLLGAAATAVPRIALAADAVRVGTANLVSDAPLFIADKLGYFKDQNVDVGLTYIASGTQMIAPLGTGELDAGAGAPSAALYNAATRGINIRAVADKGRLAPGYGYNPIMVRKDLWDDGSIRSLHDLKGRVVANAATGGASDSTINEALKKGGLGWTDIKMTILPFADMSAGFQNHAIDAGCVSEPFATAMAQKGLAVKLAGSDTFYPNQQIAVLFFGSRFIEERPDVARRFMVAYLHGVRYYYEGLKDGHYAGPHGQSVIAILSQYTPVKDPSIYAAMVPAGIDPNGYLNVASMEKDLDLWRRLGEVTDPISAAHVVDLSFVDAANRTLGRYHPTD